jgi:hypothetical protein
LVFAAAAFLRWLGSRILEFIGPVVLLIGVVVVAFATGNEVAFVVVLVLGVAAFAALILRELRSWWREQRRGTRGLM